jgi:hypothetical protein
MAAHQRAIALPKLEFPLARKSLTIGHGFVFFAWQSGASRLRLPSLGSSQTTASKVFTAHSGGRGVVPGSFESTVLLAIG